MTSFAYEYPEGYVSKDKETLEFYFETSDGKLPDLDLPDHKRPFVLGEYQAYPSPLPEWNSDYEEDFIEADMPPERVMFDKVLNTRLPEDMSPEQYDDMVYLMEVMRLNSPYRQGVWQRPYSDDIRLKILRPEWLSSQINAKSGAVVSSLYNFVTDYIPSLPIRFLSWTLERAPIRYEQTKLKIRELSTPTALPTSSNGMTYDERITAWDVVKNYDLEGTTAIVTGASSGIGREIARSLASRGATLILPSRQIASCDEMAIKWRAELRNPSIHCAKCDLADMTSIFGFLDELKASHVVPDLLVNAAAVLKPLITTSHAGAANAAIGTNLLGPMVLTEGIIGIMNEDLHKHNIPGQNSTLSSSSTSTSSSWFSRGDSSASSSSSMSLFGALAPALSGNDFNRDYHTKSTETRVRRVVHLTCSAYDNAALRSEEITADGLGSLTGVRAYSVGKLGAVAHAQHTARWLLRSGRSQNIVINSIDPGWTSDTKLHDNTFFGWWYTRFGKYLRLKNVKSPERAAAPILRLLLDSSTKTSNGLHYSGYEVTESPLSKKPASWNTKFMNALEDLKERAIDQTVEGHFKRDIRTKEEEIQNDLRPKLKQMRQWYTRQSEMFERSLELPMPEMEPTGALDVRPPPPREAIGSKPLGIGPPDAPLIGDDLRSGWHHITDTHPIMIQELVRRRNLAAPKPSPEEQAAIDKTTEEFEELKKQILEERRIKSGITSQYAEPIPKAASETWWRWFKAKVDELTKPTIHK